MTDLLLRQVSEARPGAEGDDDYDVIGDVTGGHGLVVGRIFRATTAPLGTSWMWRLSCGERDDHGHEATREAAMQAFARSWHRDT